MKIKKISISNLGNIESFEMDADKVNIFKGKNATGKTTTIQAIRSILTGAGVLDNQDLVNKDHDSGEIVVHFGEDTYIQKKLRKNLAPIVKFVFNGMALENPVSAIKNLFNQFSVDPLKFLLLKEDAKIKQILEAFPVSINLDKVSGIVKRGGMSIDMFPPDELSLPAVEALKKIRKRIFDQRTGTNRVIKEDTGKLKNLEELLPEAPPVDSKAANWQDAYQQSSIGYDGAHAELLAIELDCEAKIRKEQRKIEEKIRKEYEQKFEDMTAKKDELLQQRETALANANIESKAEGLKENIAQVKKELSKIETQSGNETLALEAIDHYQKSLVEEIPIAGLEYKDGRLYIDDVPLDQVNTARKIEIAFELSAAQMPGDKGIRVMFLDNLECLDAAHRKALFAMAKKRDIQIFAAEVDDDEFRLMSS